MKIHMFSIYVTDPAHAYRFYTEVLGFTTVVAVAEHGIYVIKAPGQDVAMLLEPATNPTAESLMQQNRSRGESVFVISTEHLDADIERLRGHGVQFDGEPFEDPSGRSILFDDSVGNLVQLHEPALQI